MGNTEAFFGHFHGNFEALTFDDVSLAPNRSSVVPRDVSLETFLTPEVPLHIPLLSADMDTVTEPALAIEMAKQGGMGFLWKHPDSDVQKSWVHTVKYECNGMVRKPITIYEHQTVDEAQRILDSFENRFSTLVVVNNCGMITGLLTGDKMQFAEPGDVVGDFMVKNPITTDKLMDVKEAYKFMEEKRVPKLIVVSAKQEPIGMFCYPEVRDNVMGLTSLYNRDNRGSLRVGANVGVFTKGDKKSEEEFERRVSGLLEAECDVLLVGTAHGDSDNVLGSVRRLKELKGKYNFGIVAGNVATYSGAIDLFDAGADTVKVGIGAGAICTTRVKTGVGIPQLSAVYDAVTAAKGFNGRVISDGGIRDSGDIVKALAVGANSVMVGGLLAAANESAGEIVISPSGERRKRYRGMGSLSAMVENSGAERYGQKGAEKLVPEGVDSVTYIEGPAAGILFRLMGGLRSGMGYNGARTLGDLRAGATFVKVTSAGDREAHPHDVTVVPDTINYSGRSGGKQ